MADRTFGEFRWHVLRGFAGLVSIDDPVSKDFPETPDRVLTKVNPAGTYETRPVSAPMTFAPLMSHTSGLGAGLVHELRRVRGGAGEAPASFGSVIPQTARPGSKRCDDGTVIIVRNCGVIAEQGRYLRTSPRFEVPDGPHAWLRQAQFVGSVSGGPRPGTVTIRVFRVR